MTPPALARISGTTRIPLSARIASAVGVVGPLAPSTTSLASIVGAVCSVMTPSTAAGTTTSQGIAKRSLGGIGSAPGNPSTVPVSSTKASSAGTSMPLSLRIVL